MVLKKIRASSLAWRGVGWIDSCWELERVRGAGAIDSLPGEQRRKRKKKKKKKEGRV